MHFQCCFFFMVCWYVSDDVACKRCIRFKFQESSKIAEKKNVKMLRASTINCPFYLNMFFFKKKEQESERVKTQ